MSDDNKLLNERLKEAIERDGIWGQCDICDGVLGLKCSEMKTCADWVKELSDEIEHDYIPRKEAEDEKREIIEAQADSAHHIMKLYAENAGMPMEDGESISKWLDRWFIPRPRFEDGEPVKEGDEVEGGIVRFIDVSSDGSWSVYSEKAEEMYVGGPGEPMKRPVPKVLDADGVRIKVGDTVWSVLSGYKIKVTDIHKDEITPYGDFVDWVGCIDDQGDDSWIRASNCTHREPDSVNRLLDDMKSYSSEHFMPDSDTKKAINGWIERIAELKLAEEA